MEKEVELFDKHFVQFMWDDSLEGKKCFVSDEIDALQEYVEHNKHSMHLEVAKGHTSYPFVINWTDVGPSDKYRFAYYDPHYEVKWAYYKEGKTVQYKTSEGEWHDCTPFWGVGTEYRVKPEEEKWCVYLAREKNGLCYLTACREDVWEPVQKEYGAKTKLFVGSTDVKCTAWYKAREQFVDLIKAWEDGAKIQVKKTDIDAWVDCDEPLWCKECQYRIKPEDKPFEDEQKEIAEPTFQEELRSLLNRFGMDNECDTPDHILRDYLASCLENYRIITKRNMLWHGWLGLGAELTEEGWKKSVESALKFLMDNRIIKSWQYNGTFHVEGNE